MRHSGSSVALDFVTYNIFCQGHITKLVSTYFFWLHRRMYKISTNQLTMTFNNKRKHWCYSDFYQNLWNMLLLWIIQITLFLWLKKKEKRQGVFCYLLTFNITYNTTGNMGLSHLNSQPGSSYSSEEYQKTAQNIWRFTQAREN